MQKKLDSHPHTTIFFHKYTNFSTFFAKLRVVLKKMYNFADDQASFKLLEAIHSSLLVCYRKGRKNG